MSENTLQVLSSGNGHTKKSLSLSKQFVTDFKTIFSKIIDASLSKITKDCCNLKDHIKKMSEYYTFEKRPVIGELIVCAYEILEEPENLSDEKRHQVYVLACAFELGTSYFLFMDDVEDDAKIRCGKPCWHLLPDVGSLVMNDASLLRSFTYLLLQQNFSQPLCFNILELVNEVYFKSSIGQRIDVTLAKAHNYNNYTMENYKEMNKMKVSFYSIELPIIFALILSNKYTKESRQQVHSICGDIGSLFQMQNDVMDLYNSDGSANLKSSTDIQTAKCSWLAVAALERSNKEQRQIFEKCYGSWDPNDVQKIKELYDELHLSQLFIQHRQAHYDDFFRKSNELSPNAVPDKAFYHKLLNVIKKIEI